MNTLAQAAVPRPVGILKSQMEGLLDKVMHAHQVARRMEHAADRIIAEPSKLNDPKKDPPAEGLNDLLHLIHQEVNDLNDRLNYLANRFDELI